MKQYVAQTPINHTLAKQYELTQKIKTTNNGYLFAPTPEDVYIATLFPDKFSIEYSPLSQNFPLRIANKS